MSRVTLTATEYPAVKKFNQSEYPRKIKISQKSIKVKLKSPLPFHVKFLPGLISEYNPNSPAPIGIAIIGVNNYIL